MGIPDRTVDLNASEEDDVYMTIAESARKENMTDMDIFAAWLMGLAAYKQSRNLDAKFPHDSVRKEYECPECGSAVPSGMKCHHNL